MDNYTTLQSLHERGVHFVLCRAADDGPRKVKSAIAARWQTKAPTLKDVLKHHAAGGLLGFIPGRSSIWALDIDTFPGEGKDTDELLASVSPLATIHTPRGRHIYFKKASSTPITNRAWALGGFAGDIRSDNGYVIAWEIEKVLEALEKLPGASPTSTTLFPKPPKAKPAVKGFTKGHRTDTLNAIVYGEEMRGQTDHSEVIEKARAAGLPDEKIAKANAKTIADAEAQKGATFPRKDADALEAALAALRITVRYNLRSMAPELANGGGKWKKTTDRTSADLRRQIADRFSYQLAGDKGTAPLRYGLDSWSEHLNAILHHLEVDPFVVWLEALPAWDGAKRLDKLLTSCLGATEGPLTTWASTYLCLGAIQRTLEPGCLLREIPILIGAQRIGKSQLLSNLLPPDQPDWFSDSVCVSDPSQKRIESLLGRVVCEMSELTGFRKAELESLKAFISRRDDGSTRLAYRHDPEPALRRFILVGSTNDPEPLPNDPSGNSRFVPIQCSKGSHIEPFMAQWRNQLWAESLVLYRAGERANLPRNLMDLQAEHGERHRRKDQIIEDAVAGIVGLGPFTIGELCGKVSPAISSSDTRAVSRLSDALRIGGWDKKHERIASGKRRYLWRRA